MWNLLRVVDQLNQQGFHASLQSVRTETAAWLSDKEYAWAQFPQDDAIDLTKIVKQVGHSGPGGFFVNHIVLGAIACRYNCDITIIQSMPDETTAFVLLSGSVFAAQNLSDAHHDETSHWRNNKM